MVQESESRFCSDHQTILQALDPIHRSLLINNSEFESINYTSRNTISEFSTTTCELLKEQQQQQRELLLQQQTQQEKQHRKSSIENKHFFDASYLKKPDAPTCVRDSNCLMLFHEPFNTADELECTSSPTDEKPIFNELQSRKNIQIRIVTNKRPSCGYKLKERMSSESQTDSSSYEYVDTDSEVEMSNGRSDEYSENSGGSINAEEFSDYHDSNNCGSSSNDEATTSSESTAPMIQIVQEITEQRTVVSTVHVNKKKVKNFQKSNTDRVTVTSTGKPKWKNKQKIMDDNVCNEILDETINWNVMDGEKLESAPVSDTIVYGVLKAKPKYSERKMGKLMERRLSRMLSDSVAITTNQNNRNGTSLQPVRNVPPAKPPRTFASSSSKTSSDSIGGNTATTVAIEDRKSLPPHQSPQMSPGGGWKFDKTLVSTTKPTCPTLDDINDFEHPKKIGWVSSVPKRDEFLQVLNMLNDDRPIASKITSSNLMPEPQFQITCKEDIDQVDSSAPPLPPLRRSKQMSMDLNDSICNSTPVKPSNLFSSHSVPTSTRSEIEFCKKCKLRTNEPSSARISFGKGAIKRTKLFFQASKNILSKSKPTPTKPYENCSENESYVDDVDETPSKLKLNTTADFNTDDTLTFEKKTEKALDLTPKQSDDGPRRILDKLLTSVKLTPPKKPIRQSLSHKDSTRSPSNNEEENFNFDRIVDSPKTKEREKSFGLSPRKLCFATNERSSHMLNNSYLSFETDQRDDLKRCIVEYLRSMNEQIEDTEGEVECVAIPRWRSRVRNVSTSSDAIDYYPHHQHVVKIDCHPEPEYSEIVVPPPTTVLNHIIVNDDPKAIYTTVNKAKNRNDVSPITVAVDEIHSENDEGVYNSWNSLDKLPINNNFADSVFNMLSLMKQHDSDNDPQMSEVDDFKSQQNACGVLASSYDVEPTAVQLTSERFQQSTSKTNDEAIDDNISMETFLTESLCEDVIRGDSVNKNIVSAFDQLEHLVTEMTLAEPETDDDLGEIGRAADINAVSDEDSVEYCDIFDENASNILPTVRSPQNHGASLKLHTSTTTATFSGNQKLQSSLVAAPSMIEIPDQFMLKLTSQIIAQREIRNQLKQAIQICRTTKEFECSSELIEAERLLLLSSKKENYAKLELKRIDYEENGLTVSPSKCVGTVTIKNIEFDLKPEEMLEQIFQLSYICICSYRDQVVATHPQERSGNAVRFDDIAIKIGSLNSSFEIKLQIFVLRLPRSLRKYSHESKYHLNKIPKKPLFSNPAKFFSNTSVSNKKSVPDTEESRFRLRGVSTITADCLSSEKFEIIRNASWPKKHVYISYNTKSLNLKINDHFSNMTGALRTEFICEVSLSDSGLTGFLSIAEENNTQREMWCRIIGCSMEFWNNDIDRFNGKSTTLSIDLVKCTNEVFELNNHKFALDIFNDEMIGPAEKNRIKRYWLSARNQNDLILWMTDLNRILKFIKDWNI